MRKVLVGIPTHGEVSALTVQSLYELARAPVSGWGFELLPFAIGPYVQLNVEKLVEVFQSQPDADYLLRVDSDMVWNLDWLRHFCKRHHSLETGVYRDIFEEGRAVIHGGVYPRRQRSQHHTPVVAPVHVDGWPLPSMNEIVRERAYIAWAAVCYLRGKTIRAGRVGGGWVLMNRAVATLAEEQDLFKVSPGEGEDYGSSRRVLENGGYVFATWPGPNSFWSDGGTVLDRWAPHNAGHVGGSASCASYALPDGPALGHVISGSDVAYVADYFRAASRVHDVAACRLEQDVTTLPVELFEDLARPEEASDG